MKYISMISILCATLFANSIYAQRTELKPSIKGDFKLPVVTGNKAFNDIMDGVIDIDIVGQYPFKSGLMFGIGGKVQYFEINDLALTPIVTDGSNLGWSVYGKVGYEKLTGANTFVELAVNAGLSNYIYDTRQCESTNNNSGFFFEPRMGFYLFATEQLAFGLITSYQFIFQDFGHEQLCLETLPRHQTKDAEGNLGIFTIGLGFSAGLARSASAFR